MKGLPAKDLALIWERHLRLAVWLGIIAGFTNFGSLLHAGLPGSSTGLQLLTTRASGLIPSAGGDGNSDLPIISTDGRYVLFASTADNLVTLPNPGPASGLGPKAMQVFIRDRVAGSTTLVSVNSAGIGGNGDSFPDAISTNGQFVLFESAANDLTSNDTNNSTDIFLRDLVQNTTTIISVSTNGTAANGNSYNATMTPDARYLAFVSAASNIVPGDSNGIPDIFVRGRVAGTTTLVSVGAMASGSLLPPSTSESPDITPDGRFVAFYTTATNFIPGLTNVGQIFVRDLVAHTTVWASTNAQSLYQASYKTTSEIACNPRISADGQHVAFEVCNSYLYGMPTNGLLLRYNLQTGLTDEIISNAVIPAIQLANINSLDTLDMTPDGQFIAFVAPTNSAQCIEVWSAQSGNVTVASQNVSGGETAGDTAYWPRIDATGHHISFVATAANLTTNTASGYNCYLRDLQAGTTTLISVDTNGNGGGASQITPPSLSGDGQTIAFVANDGSLAANDDNTATDIFVRNNAANTTELISVRDTNLPNASANGLSGFSGISVSSNGLFVAFASEASDLTANDTNAMPDVFVRDVANASNILVSINTNGFAAGGMSIQPSMSADGRYVAFSSTATDLTGNDTNNSRDIFVRDRQTGITTLASQDFTGTGEGIGDSYSPILSADGRYVLYFSLAQNLSSGSFASGTLNLFLRDLQMGTNYALTFDGVISAAMTPDGHRVALIGKLLDNTTKLYVWDTHQAGWIYTNNLGLSINLTSISPDGNLIAYSDTSLKVANLFSNTVTGVSAGVLTPEWGARFSNDGRFLVYSSSASNVMTDTNSLSDIYLYDFQSGTNTLISHSFNSSAGPNGAADAPTISPDGRFIAYRSLASNNVPADLNGVPDLLLYDRSNFITLLITPSLNGNWTANNRSSAPVFSADGKSLVFSSLASDLAAAALNNRSDIFRLPLNASSIITTNGDGSPITVSGLQLLWTAATSQNPTVNWPATVGTVYQVQYKNDLMDPVWHNVNGQTTISGNLGQTPDLAPSMTNRFYRVILSN